MRTLNLGILAHVDAGKTSLTERLLFDTGAIDKLGSVDGGNTQTDSLELERQRGITIAAAVAAFRIGDLSVNLIDTPGHPDFIAEVARVLRLLDAAIVVVSAVEGIQAQTRVLVRALQRLRIPFLFFVNKIDRAGARYEDVLADIARQLAVRPLAMSNVTDIGSRRALVKAIDIEQEPHLSRLCEALALGDATLLDDYVLAPERLGSRRLQKAIATQLSKGLVHPAYSGIAMTGIGLPDLIDAIETLLPSRLPDPSLPVRGSVFKIERGWGGEKLAYIKLESGTVSARGTIELPTGRAKITSLQVFGEPGLRRCDHARAGQIVKVGGLAGARIGDLIGPDTGHAFVYQFAPPTIETRAVARRSSENRALWLALQQLSEQDPLINLRSTEDASEMYLSLYGEVQKEIVQATLLAEFGVDATFEKSTVIYAERPTSSASALQTIFRDPNPFLATIGLRVEPRSPGSGNVYTVEADVGQMPISFYRAIEETVSETLKAAVFGWQVIDCQVVLTAVRHSSPSSTAADFRGLTPLVLAEALSHAEMIVCEPVEHFRLEVPATTLPVMATLLAKYGALISETLIENSTARLDGMIASIHVQSIRTCKRHGVRLVSSAELARSPFQHDFAANLAAESSRIPRFMASAEAAEPDNLQTYVEKRLKGDRSGADWLDSLPLYVAIRLCEIVGASLLHGNLFRSSGFGDREWSESSGAGYDLLKEGEPAFRQYLEAQVDDFHRGKGSGGERSIFGRLYLTLAHRTTEAAFDPIRSIMRDVAIHNLPLGPGDEFFGPITSRKFHTIHSASKTHGIPFERLNKLVLDAGLFPSETSGGGGNLIEARAVDRIVTEMAATFNQKEVITKLGVTRKLGRQLINGGLLKPSFKVKQRPGARIVPRYPAEQVTILLANLRAVAKCTDMSELHDLHTSIKRCGCTFIEAINLIRSEKLSKVGWDESEIRLASLRVDPIEMRLLMMRQNSIISDRQSKRSMVGPQPHGSPNRQLLL